MQTAQNTWHGPDTTGNLSTLGPLVLFISHLLGKPAFGGGYSILAGQLVLLRCWLVMNKPMPLLILLIGLSAAASPPKMTNWMQD
jgi:hypothetical protein